MSGYLFPYGIRFQDGGALEVFPMAELDVVGKNGAGIHAVFHIDSGATTSALPAVDAEVLGISLKKGKKILVRGILGDGANGYIHGVKIRFKNKKEFRIPIIFVEHESVPRVLGREGIFSLFTIIFEEKKRRTGLLLPKTKESLIVSKTLDKIK
jgi:hypothetical protein